MSIGGRHEHAHALRTSKGASTAKSCVGTGARVTFLPSLTNSFTHYTLAPVSAMQPVIRHLVGAWNDTEVETSVYLNNSKYMPVNRPARWQFLFFHEYPVHGGDANRPFFLQALGQPQPVTSVPNTLPK